MATTERPAQCSIPNKESCFCLKAINICQLKLALRPTSLPLLGSTRWIVSWVEHWSPQVRRSHVFQFDLLRTCPLAPQSWDGGSLNSWLQPTMHWLCPYASSKPFVFAYSELQKHVGTASLGIWWRFILHSARTFVKKAFIAMQNIFCIWHLSAPPTPLNLMSNPFWVCTLWFLCVCMNIYTYLYIYQSIDIILIQSYINLDLYNFIYTHITGYMCVCAYTYTYITYTLYTHICTHIHIV